MELLTPDILISAYAQGIFPMGVQGRIRWFSPDPRAILPLDGFRASKTLRRTCRSGKFKVRVNTRFGEVIEASADRPEGTWITGEIIDAYGRLHDLGVAHSVECLQDERLAGGLYGVALGGAFFGESMFHHVRDASKVALVFLVDRMKTRGYRLLDVQYITEHLAQFGAIEISREAYLQRLAGALQERCRFTDVPPGKTTTPG